MRMLGQVLPKHRGLRHAPKKTEEARSLAHGRLNVPLLIPNLRIDHPAPLGTELRFPG
jgi:hypothetical protein